MSNPYLRFKQFTVWQDQCGMKVGTDGCLLGAWAHGGHRILDIGTGMGIMALMMAQRFETARVTAIDIDAAAVRQASDNVSRSPFSARIQVEQADILAYHAAESYDTIVSNPPFFIDSLASPDEQRTLARHAQSLSYEALTHAAAQLLSDEGEFSVVVPFDYRSRMESAAALASLSLCRSCAVRTSPRKPPRRYLLAFRKQAAVPAPQTELTIGSADFESLLSPFYLNL